MTALALLNFALVPGGVGGRIGLAVLRTAAQSRPGLDMGDDDAGDPSRADARDFSCDGADCAASVAAVLSAPRRSRPNRGAALFPSLTERCVLSEIESRANRGTIHIPDRWPRVVVERDSYPADAGLMCGTPERDSPGCRSSRRNGHARNS